MKLLCNEITTAWTKNNISLSAIEKEIMKMEDEIRTHMKPLTSDQLMSFEKDHLSEANRILHLSKKDFLNVKFQRNPFLVVFNSEYTYSSERTEKFIALIPKFIAFAEPKILPLYLTYERRFFTQFHSLPAEFSGADLIEKSIKKNGIEHKEYWEGFYEYILKRFLSFFLITPIIN